MSKIPGWHLEIMIQVWPSPPNVSGQGPKHLHERVSPQRTVCCLASLSVSFYLVVILDTVTKRCFSVDMVTTNARFVHYAMFLHLIYFIQTVFNLFAVSIRIQNKYLKKKGQSRYIVSITFLCWLLLFRIHILSITFSENKGENQQRQLKTKIIVFYGYHYKKSSI